EFCFAPYCELTVDAMTFLLSYMNQLCACNCNVSLAFDAEHTINQFEQDGFFKYLSPAVTVFHAGSVFVNGLPLAGILSDRIIKIVNISTDISDRTVPARLTDAILNTVKDKSFTKLFNIAAYTIIAELVDNILQHSSTKIDGFAGVEISNGGKIIRIAISDSGTGILQTLRPALITELPKLNRLKDIELLIEVFRKGVSCHGQGRGCGLKTSADWAIKFDATLEIRLSNTRIALFPDNGKYELNNPIRFVDLLPILGTHICFTFNLDI
ncbi:MAG: ATP-binding protein, partial [Desulfuromonadaceae bacterium]|nr:ATP-binding protein [Desulfuromonadaceae bacterium]